MTVPSTIVSVAWLQEHLHDPDLVVIDVRPAIQYQNGHIPGAILLDPLQAKLLSSAPEAVARWHQALQALIRAAGLTTGSTIVAYEDVSGTNAAYAVWLAHVARLAGAAMLDGGFNAWLASGAEISGDPVSPAPSDFTLEPDTTVVATAQEIAGALADNVPVQILDTRGDQEWYAATIPGAVHREWTDNLKADGAFRPVDEMRANLVAAGLDLDAPDPIIAFCGSGLRAANAWVVLRHLGAKHPQNYGPSWSEWGRHPQTPKVRPE